MRSSSRACSGRRTDPPRVRPAVFRRRCIEVDKARGDSPGGSPRNDDFCRLHRARRVRGARHETCLTCPCDLRAYAQPMRILRDRGGCAAREPLRAAAVCLVVSNVATNSGSMNGTLTGAESHGRRADAGPAAACGIADPWYASSGKRRSIEIRTYESSNWPDFSQPAAYIPPTARYIDPCSGASGRMTDACPCASNLHAGFESA